MSSWQELIQVAMLGTDRQPLPRFHDDDPAAELLTIPDESNEKQLLDRIAVHAYRRRAAALPSIRLGALPGGAPADSLPICTAAAARSLDSFIVGSKTWLVKEWLTLAKQVGVRPPDEKLPELLDAGRRIKTIRHLVYDTIGNTRSLVGAAAAGVALCHVGYG